MDKLTVTLLGAAAVCAGFAVNASLAQEGAPSAPQSAAPPRADDVGAAPAQAEDHDLTVGRYCFRCHNDQLLTGGLSFESFSVSRASEQAEVAEKMIRKLRAGMMPPPGAQQPDTETSAALVAALETNVDDAAAADPNPGARTFQRLNRAEYEHAIRDLLALEVDAGDWLPLDQMSANFDNIAAAQPLSPMLLESYLNAASEISRLAVGDRDAPPIDHTYTAPIYVSQHPWDRVEGAPYGTRGGMVVEHVFPADAEYVFGLTFSSGSNSRLEDIDISINGERVSLLAYNTQRRAGADGRGSDLLKTEPIFVKAGQHIVSAAFIRKSEGPYEDLIRPHDWSFAGGGSGGIGITTLPHLESLVISGPYAATGISKTPSRERIFTCRPTQRDEELPCARRILDRLASAAYRRPLAPGELDRLMPFYEAEVESGDFEVGVQRALEAILASPFFVLRLESEPGEAEHGGLVRLNDIDIASRLSFFLWGTLPDDELRALATAGRLSEDAELERQVRRMLADPRSEALASRFASQWLRLQDLYKVHPDPNFYPDFDEMLAGAMQRETELFFNYLVRADRSVLELFDADYTFVNERLARHYGFAGVSGPSFRRVDYPDERRRGLLGHGSILVLTSLANRTSPVLRGKWVMEVLMGTPPPPPPPNVPDLDETAGTEDGKILTTRERMAIHRENPSCNSCHRFMDPIGLALDNFDVTARWRVREYGQPLDTRGDFYDGTPVSTPAELVDVLLKRPEPLVRNFTENLLAYALGRRAEYYDQPTIRAIVRDAAADEYRMSSFIVGVVLSDAFRMKRIEPFTDDGAPSGRRNNDPADEGGPVATGRPAPYAR